MSHRLEQLDSLFKKEIGRAILLNIDLPRDSLVTVTRAKTAADLSQVKVLISVLPEEKREIVLQTLQKNIFELRSCLNARLKMKKIPKIKFMLDLSEEKAARINKLLDEITGEIE